MTKLFTTALILLAFSACSKDKKKYESPAGYDFNRPDTKVMPEELREISGITFFPGTNDRLFAIQDEDGLLFYWNNGSPDAVAQIPFGKHGDYEDLAMTRDFAVILRSDGNLFIFPAQEMITGAVHAVTWKKIVPPGEYEGLYADPATGNIYILCKNCDTDKKSSRVIGYTIRLDAQGVPQRTGGFSLDMGTVPGLTFKGALRPSALTFNKQTGEWYLLSSVKKMLIIADKDWKPKQAIHLNPRLFPQPEGITFDIDNNLYIANEAGNTNAGTVLKFVFEQPDNADN